MKTDRAVEVASDSWGRMTATESVACPFCLSKLDAKASVCRECRREVRDLIDARRELARLRADLQASSVPGPEEQERAKDTRVRRLIGWLYYVSCIAAVIGFSNGPGELMITALTVLAATSLALVARSVTAWGLFLLGFVAPTLTVAGMFLAGKGDASLLPILLDDLLRHSLSNAAIAAGTGLLLILLFRRKDLHAALDPGIALRWLALSGGRLESLEKAIVRLAAIAAALTPFAAWLWTRVTGAP